MSTSTPPRIAYLLKRFPRLSETFILHEILELERQGIDLTLYSLLDPAEESQHPAVREVRASVHYFPVSAWAMLWRGLLPHLRFARRSPRRYLAAVQFALHHQQWRASLKHFWRAGYLAQQLADAQISHLHAHFAHGPASVAQFVHLLTGLPYSFTAHAKDIYTSPMTSLSNKLGSARFVVTCTGFNRGYLAGLVPAAVQGKIHTLYHGVDLRRFAPSARQAGETPLLLSAGRLVAKKGFPVLLDACKMLVQRGVPFQCQIVGQGEMRADLQGQIERLALQQHVQLVGAMTQDGLIEMYRRAAVFALPSVVLENGDRDGIPNVLVEAMSMGVPVVSTDISGIPELVHDGVTGRLVPPHDAAALADALQDLLENPSHAAALAANGQRFVAEQFDLRACAARLRRLLTTPGTRIVYVEDQPAPQAVDLPAVARA